MKTDSRTVEDPKDPDACNVLKLLALVCTSEELEEWRERYRAGGVGYGESKKRLAELLEVRFGPMREKREALAKDPDYVEDVLREGAGRARAIALEVMEDVRMACGIVRLSS